jgi:hypothetical protein
MSSVLIAVDTLQGVAGNKKPTPKETEPRFLGAGLMSQYSKCEQLPNGCAARAAAMPPRGDLPSGSRVVIWYRNLSDKDPYAQLGS